MKDIFAEGLEQVGEAIDSSALVTLAEILLLMTSLMSALAHEHLRGISKKEGEREYSVLPPHKIS